MNLKSIVDHAADMENFTSISDFFDFSKTYLDFIRENIQA